MLKTRKINSAQLARLSRRLFADTDERSRFEKALTDGVSGREALIWLGARPDEHPFPALPPFGWQPDFVDRISAEHHPGQHALHQAGSYYCLDLSSVFEACALTGVDRAPASALDLCAAPGGKSFIAWRMFRPETFVANETIGKRVPALLSNLKRCRVPALIANADPERIAQAWPDTFELVIVDAPCSGQSLLARGEENPGCLHPLTIGKNAGRQKRIVAAAAKALAPGGYLAYMTCTFAEEENEEVLEWLLRKFGELEPVEVSALADYCSPHSDAPCYRLFPQAGAGAGGFCALVRRPRGSLEPPRPLDREKLRLIQVHLD